jgi:hypothetical protein
MRHFQHWSVVVASVTGFAMPGINEWSVVNTSIGAQGQQR